jgi:hypothetical protein
MLCALKHTACFFSQFWPTLWFAPKHDIKCCSTQTEKAPRPESTQTGKHPDRVLCVLTSCLLCCTQSIRLLSLYLEGFGHRGSICAGTGSSWLHSQSMAGRASGVVCEDQDHLLQMPWRNTQSDRNRRGKRKHKVGFNDMFHFGDRGGVRV